MSKHAEIIFETGAKSVVSYDDEVELRDFLVNHTERAITGQPGSAQDWVDRADLREGEPELAHMAERAANRPAERVSKVLLYDEHPADYTEHGVLFKSDVDALVAAVASDPDSDGSQAVDVNELIGALRREINACISGDIGPHDSLYKMPHTKEMNLDFLDGGAVIE